MNSTIEMLQESFPSSVGFVNSKIWYVVQKTWISQVLFIRIVFLAKPQFIFKNVSNWVTFLWQTQTQTIKYGLNDTKQLLRNESFQMNLMVHLVQRKESFPLNLKSNVQGVVLNERSYYYTFLGLRGSY